jgi:hypothetical protein
MTAFQLRDLTPSAVDRAGSERSAAGYGDTAQRSLAGRRILYVTHRFPFPPNDGARVRAFHAIRHLAGANAVTVVAPVRSTAEAAQVDALAALGVEVRTVQLGRAAALARTVANAVAGRSASRGYFDSPGLRAELRALARQRPFDLAVVHCSAVAHYAAELPVPVKVLDFVDMDSRKWLDYRRFAGPLHRSVYAWEGWSLGRLERRMARRFDLCLTTTAHEDATLRAIAGPVARAVVRNGVDLDHFRPAGAACDPDRICFLGRMDYFPNEQAMVGFCHDVLPRLQAVRPGLRLSIVGADPGPRVRALARLPGVEVTGRVPDVRPYVQRAALTVAPLLIARGTQNKILESLAMGVPVVASGLACRGVDAEVGRDLLRADGPAETAEQVLGLLDDPDTRARFAANGRRLVERRYSWTATMESLEAHLAAALAAG